MIPTTGWLLSGALVAAVLWFASGLLGDVRDRLSERFGSWLLPDAQPVTYRVAFAIAMLAKWIAPQDRAMIEWSYTVTSATGDAKSRAEGTFTIDSRSWRTLQPVLVGYGSALAAVMHVQEAEEMVLRCSPPRLQRTRWESPDAAAAELEMDMFTGRQLLRPVSLVLPLLRYAVVLRYSNLVQRVRLCLFRIAGLLGRAPVPTGVVARYPRESNQPLVSDAMMLAVTALWRGDMNAVNAYLEIEAEFGEP